MYRRAGRTVVPVSMMSMMRGRVLMPCSPPGAGEDLTAVRWAAAFLARLDLLLDFLVVLVFSGVSSGVSLSLSSSSLLSSLSLSSAGVAGSSAGGGEANSLRFSSPLRMRSASLALASLRACLRADFPSDPRAMVILFVLSLYIQCKSSG